MDHYNIILLLLVLFVQVSFVLAENHNTQALLGVYYFNNEFDLNMTNINRMEKWLGGGKKGFKHSVLQFFTEWCPAMSMNLDWYTTVTVRSHLHTFWSAGSVPLMTWQPTCYDPSLNSQSLISKSIKTPDNFLVQIGSGMHDSYIYKMIEEIKDFLAGPDGVYGNRDDRRMYMRLGHEMNGNWFQWSAAKNQMITAVDYTKMWIHVRKLFDQQLRTTAIKGDFSTVDLSERIQWIWCPNNFDVGPVLAEEYYPGDPYVDWIGMDVYNRGGVSRKASSLMLPMLRRFERLSPTKPIAVPEFGTEYNYWYEIDSKENWIKDFFAQVDSCGVGMAVLFNKDLYSVYGPSKNSPTIHEYGNIVRKQFSSINVEMSLEHRSHKIISNAAFKGYIPNYPLPVKDSTEWTVSYHAISLLMLICLLVICCYGYQWQWQWHYPQPQSSSKGYRVIEEGGGDN